MSMESQKRRHVMKARGLPEGPGDVPGGGAGRDEGGGSWSPAPTGTLGTRELAGKHLEANGTLGRLASCCSGSRHTHTHPWGTQAIHTCTCILGKHTMTQIHIYTRTWRMLHKQGHTPENMPPHVHTQTYTLQGTHDRYTHLQAHTHNPGSPLPIHRYRPKHTYTWGMCHMHTNTHTHQGIHMYTKIQTHLSEHTPRTHTGSDRSTHLCVENTTQTCARTLQGTWHTQIPTCPHCEDTHVDRRSPSCRLVPLRPQPPLSPVVGLHQHPAVCSLQRDPPPARGNTDTL